ncbi:ATP-binding protein [Nocardia sp. NBC_01377]|uniref:ATP-binding protein n=1 Tax=Nocardia sp. NBC_01377 TaxID=2903595 RepID=UPI00324A8CAD
MSGGEGRAYDDYVENLCALHAAAGGLRAKAISAEIKKNYGVVVPPLTIKGWLKEDREARRIPREGDKFKLMLGVLYARTPMKFDGRVPQQWEERRRKASQVVHADRRADRANVSPVLDTVVHSEPVHDVGDGIGDLLTTDLDPIELGVHKAITTSDRHENAELLTRYVPRRHDQDIADVVGQAVAGHSRFVVLHGGSSTGKTRTLWEALAPLREQGGWRLWHPTSPTRRAALADDIGRVRRRTVLWLNESQEFLGGDGRPGDEIAAVALRDLLADTSQAPVLVVGTLWRAYYTELCRPHASQVRALLENNAHTTVLEVPDSFADADPTELAAAAEVDPRMRFAADHAEDDRVTQYLAGGPELVRRYSRELTIAAKAIVRIAMDARRMGHRNEIPHGLLADATHAYLTRSEWNTVAAAPDWLEQALKETTRSCNGASGPLTPIAAMPLSSRPLTTLPTDVRTTSKTTYLLADYLDQHGRTERAETPAPTAFWQALTVYTHPGDRADIGYSAASRGLYRNAAQLWVEATRAGETNAAVRLLYMLRAAHPDNDQLADWLISQPIWGTPGPVASLLRILREGGWTDQTQRLIERALPEITVDDPQGLGELLWELREGGWTEQAQRLIERALPEITVYDPFALGMLLWELRKGGWTEHARHLIEHVGSKVTVGPGSVTWLMETLSAVGWTEHTQFLIERAMPEIILNESEILSWLLRELREGGWTEHAQRLIERVVSEVDLDSPGDLGWLMEALRKGGFPEHAQNLIERALPEITLGQPDGIASLLRELRKSEWDEHAQNLIERALPEITLGQPYGIASLLQELREGGFPEHAQNLIERALPEITLDGETSIRPLLDELAIGGWTEQTQRLVERLPAVADFDLFLKYVRSPERYIRYGRDPETGAAASSWSWEDLI